MRIPIKGFEGYYEIDEEGNIWSFHADGRHRQRGFGSKVLSEPRKMKPITCGPGKGYLMVNLRKPGAKRQAKVHHLVADHFIEPRPKGKEINHKNGDTHDNRIQNLEWVTRSENMMHSYRELGRVGPWKGREFSDEHKANIGKRSRGEGNGRAKLDADQVREIRSLAGKVTQKELATRYGVATSLISLIVTRRCWKHI